jgi:hypothetical protein
LGEAPGKESWYSEKLSRFSFCLCLERSGCFLSLPTNHSQSRTGERKSGGRDTDREPVRGSLARGPIEVEWFVCSVGVLSARPASCPAASRRRSTSLKSLLVILGSHHLQQLLLHRLPVRWLGIEFQIFSIVPHAPCVVPESLQEEDGVSEHEKTRKEEEQEEEEGGGGAYSMSSSSPQVGPAVKFVSG